MSLRPVLANGSWLLLGVIVVVMAAALWWSGRQALRSGADPAETSSWLRRAALAVVTALVLAGPSVPSTQSAPVSNVEIYFVVDRTGSMAAEDWAGGPSAGGATRLEGVKSDLAAIVDANPEARFSIIALDSSAARELPLTSDTTAVRSWIDSLQQEVTDRSSGSSMERALPLLHEVLAAAAKNDPQDVRVVFLLSDGEATDDGAGAADAQAAGVTWQGVGELVDAGAVVGYGTAQGAGMREFDGSAPSATDPDAPYIKDPDSGGDAVSVPDTEALAAVAQALGVPYVQRTGGGDDVPASDFAELSVEAVLSDGRRRLNDQRYLVWPLGLVAAGLFIWELVALAGAERDLRRLTGSAARGATR